LQATLVVLLVAVGSMLPFGGRMKSISVRVVAR
jgi:hypothetical protein